MTLVQEYRDLLIKQYRDQPRARAEIELQAGGWERVADFYRAFFTEFDLDIATGDRLDKIGKLVGISRNLPEPLSDEDYRFFIRVRIAKNIAGAVMVSDEGTSLQDVIQLAFEGAAVVLDNQDMSLDLIIEDGFDLDRLSRILRLDLLPKPQGVRYNITAQTEPDVVSFQHTDETDLVGDFGHGELGAHAFEFEDGSVLAFEDGSVLGMIDSNDLIEPTEGGTLAELFV